MTNDTVKRCSTCGDFKPRTEFSPRKSAPDGLHYTCKKCASEKVKIYYHAGKGKETHRRWAKSPEGQESIKNADRKYRKTAKRKEKKKGYDRKYLETSGGRITHNKAVAKHKKTDSYKAYVKVYDSLCSKEHPERAKARASVYNAIRRKELPRATEQTCQLCKSPAHQYHHHNGYDPEHWLDVIPVCRKCHNEIHNPRLSLIP